MQIVSDVTFFGTENIVNIVREVGQVVGIPIEKRDIDARHRLYAPKDQGPPAIIIKFVRRLQESAFIQKGRAKRLTVKTFGGRTDRPVFIDEHLINRTAEVYKAARKLRYDKYVDYAWVKKGKVSVRRAAGERVIQIASTHQIEELRKKLPRRDTEESSTSRQGGRRPSKEGSKGMISRGEERQTTAIGAPGERSLGLDATGSQGEGQLTVSMQHNNATSSEEEAVTDGTQGQQNVSNVMDK